MGEWREKDRTWVEPNPLLCFVLDGVRFAVAQNTRETKDSPSEPWTWAEAKAEVIRWFPYLDEQFTSAEIVIPELEEHDGEL